MISKIKQVKFKNKAQVRLATLWTIGYLIIFLACVAFLVGKFNNNVSAKLAPGYKSVSSVSTANTKLIYSDNAGLAASLKAYRAGDPSTKNEVNQLLGSTNKIINAPIKTVTSKSQTPPSGDKHDYMSLADYYWPNPDTKSGLPYVRKDGHTNPATSKIPDKANFNTFLDDTNDLALSYYFTGKAAYAQKAGEEIKAWFVNPSTKMDPNLNYAQMIPGQSNDGTGIIDLRYLPQVMDDTTLISSSNVLSSSDQATLSNWAESYMNWLLTSKPGQKQSAEPNNHGTWYSAQIIALSAYLNNAATGNTYIDNVKSLINKQITASGTQPLELARTRSWDYSVLNLDALLHAGVASKNYGVNLLTYTNPSGASIKTAFTYLIPYVNNEGAWPYSQITDFKTSGFANILAEADYEYQDNFGFSASAYNALKPDDSIQLAFPMTH